LVALVCLAGAAGLDQAYPFAQVSPLVVFAMLAVSIPLLWLSTTKLLGLQIYFEVTQLLQAIVRRLKPTR
jgi:hypothetical protein